ncbi:MAG: hypothetical protein MI924_39595 [Chloroflexales bacterium]|nr:hypothetical protein [Chloroflexales bacterium]
MIDLADLNFDQGQFEHTAKLYDEAVALESRNLYAHAMRIYSTSLQSNPIVAQEALSAIADYGRDNNDLYE